MTLQDDTEFEEVVLKSVDVEKDGFNLERSDGWHFFAPKISGHEPRPGMTARFYGKGIGYPVRGLVIDGQQYFYRTPKEETERHAQECRDADDKKRSDFEKNRHCLDAAYNDLPPEFKRRLDRFRLANVNFRWQFESYEMMCCTDAVNIATKLKTVEAIDEWKDLPYERQKELVSINDGHSGNSFGCAVHLAKLWLTNPVTVEFAHGALTPLVGCKDYGCSHV